MERFKAAEKEMKTKAFSKEGLIAAAKLGPTEKAKLEMSQWLTSMVDELSRQTEVAEAEIEQSLASSKRSKKASSKDDRVGELEHQIERRNWHISRLEILLRMLENGTLDVERINDVKEDIAYFVESNIEDDFEEDEGIYDEFNLDEEEEAFGLKDAEDAAAPEPEPEPAVTEDPAPKPAAKETKKEETKKEETKKEEKKAASKKTVAAPEPPLKERVVTNFEQGKLQSTASVTPTAPKASTPTAVLPPIRYAAAAAAAVGGASSVTSPGTASAPVAPSPIVPAASTGTDADTSSASAKGATDTSTDAGRPVDRASGDVRLPDTLSDLVSSFEWAKQKSLARESNLPLVQRTLDSSYAGGVPEPVDSESPKHYVPKDPFPTSHYYPQSPASIFDNPALYAKFDVDTLFYIFYYQQGTYHQYLAARELKKQSWRFHKQYLTWFQRHSEPQVITDEYEQGAYVYFDWEGSWCQRRKNDFRFEYRWLEDN